MSRSFSGSSYYLDKDINWLMNDTICGNHSETRAQRTRNIRSPHQTQANKNRPAMKTGLFIPMMCGSPAWGGGDRRPHRSLAQFSRMYWQKQCAAQWTFERQWIQWEWWPKRWHTASPPKQTIVRRHVDAHFLGHRSSDRQHTKPDIPEVSRYRSGGWWT